jgi:hypothetical protein
MGLDPGETADPAVTELNPHWRISRALLSAVVLPLIFSICTNQSLPWPMLLNTLWYRLCTRHWEYGNVHVDSAHWLVALCQAGGI